jgi:four helix bundle protein
LRIVNAERMELKIENAERNGSGYEIGIRTGVAPFIAVRAQMYQEPIRNRTFRFACRIVHLHPELARRGDIGRTIGGQLLRSATSIGANLEEADAGQSRPDFISKCNIALKEARETAYWLRLIQETTASPLAALPDLIVESGEIVAILTAIVRNARASLPGQ